MNKAYVENPNDDYTTVGETTKEATCGTRRNISDAAEKDMRFHREKWEGDL